MIRSKHDADGLVGFGSTVVILGLQREVTETQLVYTVMAAILESEAVKELFPFQENSYHDFGIIFASEK